MEPLKVRLKSKYDLYTAPIPGSGAILAFILNMLDGFLKENEPESVVNYQRIIESFKYGFAKRTELGDTNFVEGVQEV